MVGESHPETVDIIGSVGPEPLLSQSALEELLASQDPERLGRGDFFIGRPGTGIISRDGLVAKVRLDLDMDWATSRRWIEHALTQERSLGLHHPRKTWFLARIDGENRIGNVAPLLTPLHKDLPELPADEQHALLTRLLVVYLDAAARLKVRLDEGLSNFGRDPDGVLYYLDDDTYEWDNFLSLSEALGYWIRLDLGLEADGFTALGESLAAAILENFGDPHWLRVMARRVNRLFTGNPDQTERREALMAGLQEGHGSFRASVSSVPREAEADQPASDKLAVIADVHANRPALEAVLDHLRSAGIAKGFVLGDLVGYGPHPQDCIDLLKATDFTLIKGNHDHGAANDIPRKGFSNTAYWVIQWTREVLDKETKAWLDDLPCYLEGDDWIALHGSPRDPSFFNGYVYQMTYEVNLDEMAERGVRTCFHGHTHIQGTYFRDGEGEDGFEGGEEQELGEWRHCLACPGSVGQPRDKIPGAAFAIFDPTTNRLTNHRVDYDVEPVIKDMEGQGFPQPLLDRLRFGR